MEIFLFFYWLFSALVTFPICMRNFNLIVSVVLCIFLGWLVFPLQLGATISEIVK